MTTGMDMKKVGFILLVIANGFALFQGGSSFFVTFAQLPDHPHAYYEGIEAMRDFLLPSLKWLAGAALVNLAFVGIAAFYRSRPHPKLGVTASGREPSVATQ